MTAIRTTRAALPHLIQSGGVVVNVSSVNGHLPGPSIYSYSAGKAAMNNLTVGLSLEFARQGVRVVGVAPGPVSTPLWLGPEGVAATVAARTGSDPQKVVDEAIAEIPIGRFTTPEEVGDLVAFLAKASAPGRSRGPRSESTAASRPACNARSAFFAKHSITRAIYHRLLSPPATACDAHGVG